MSLLPPPVRGPAAPSPAAPPRPPRPALARSIAGLAVMTVLVLGPAYLFTRLTVMRSPVDRAAVATQQDVVGRPADPALIARLRAAPSDPSYPPAVITYHDIAVHGSQYTVTPQAFADQMRLLHDSGWHPLSSEEFLAWLHGGRLPAHSVLITFDDGAKGVWQYADPVFARYHLRGVAFIITGFVGTHQPYYMTWPEVQRLGTSGRWDLGAHTYLGHIQVTADAAGHQQPFLSTTMWLPAQHRQETPAEFSTRVSDDLQHCISDLVAHGAPRPVLFAFPFSAIGESALGARLHTIVNGLFDAAFLDSPAGRPTSDQETLNRQFRRVDMLRSTTSTDFVTNIEDSLQSTVPTVDTTHWRQQAWVSTSAAPVQLPTTGAVALTAALARNKWGEIQLDPDHTSFWNSYRSTAVVSGLDTDVAASVHALLHSPDQVQVVVSSSAYIVYNVGTAHTRVITRGDLPQVASTHTVVTTVRPGSVEIRIDGRRVAAYSTRSGSRGGIAIGGDPLHQQRVPLLDSVTVTPVTPVTPASHSTAQTPVTPASPVTPAIHVTPVAIS